MLEIFITIIVAAIGGTGVVLLERHFRKKDKDRQEKLADNVAIRDGLWSRHEALWDEVKLLQEQNNQLLDKFNQLEKRYKSLVFVLKTLKTDPQFKNRIEELLEIHSIYMNGHE